MHFSRPAPLTDAEMLLIEEFLERSGGKIDSFEMLDGFLAALVTGPEVMAPSRYIPILFGGPGEGEELVFDTPEQFHRVFELLIQHWNGIVTTLLAGEPWPPVLETVGAKMGRWWARGFMTGMTLGPGWGRFTGDPAHESLFLPLTVLSEGPVRLGSKRPPKVSVRIREGLVTSIALSLPALCRAIRPTDGELRRPRRQRPGVKRPKRKPTQAKRPKRPRRSGG